MGVDDGSVGGFAPERSSNGMQWTYAESVGAPGVSSVCREEGVDGQHVVLVLPRP